MRIGSPALAQEEGGGPIGPGSRYGLESEPPAYYYDQGYRGPYHGWAYDRPYRAYNPLGAAADVAGGVVNTAGAIATASFRAFDNGASYAMGERTSYCEQRYRSYDPASGTFMGYDGRRRPCV